MAPPELVVQTRTKRSNSISSDRPSANGYGGLLSPPLIISPEPSFIAASAASQIVTNDHDSRSDSWFDQLGIEPSGETALVMPAALKLVNRFLDQLLFNFLSISKSTSLAALRPAVTEVLKPKLARDAINGAEQELHEYLGGGDDEELMAFHNGLESSGDWDLELIWKRTRLRCMVYSSLGDMEEEDEDEWTEREHLEDTYGSGPGVVSPAVAIFLTSILEFMGEQVLVVAGQTAYQRLKAKLEKDAKEGTSLPVDIAERVVVDENDTERVTLDRTLGRLWRGWKKRVRSPTTSISMARSFSRENLQPGSSRAASVMADDDVEGDMRRKSLAAVLAEYEVAAGIPLPMSADDVREIEIPGLALKSDDEEDEDDNSDNDFLMARPKSFIDYSHKSLQPVTPTSPPGPPFLTPATRKRSHSHPTPTTSPYSFFKRQKASSEAGDEGMDVDPMASGLRVDEPAQVEGEEETREESQEESNGILAGIVSGAAAVAGIAAIATGKAPQTELDTKSEVDAEEDLVEEPQIMTSSRVSIGSRNSIDYTGAGLSRHSSSTSHRVASPRLIDVASPRSPSVHSLSRAGSVRERGGSVDASDYLSGRPVINSRPISAVSPLSDTETPRVASPVSRLPNSSPLSRVGSASLHTRHSAGESISEVDEPYEPESAPITAIPSDLAAAMQGVDFYPSTAAPQFPSKEVEAPQPPPAPAPAPAAFVLSAAPPARHPRDPNLARQNQVNQVSQPNGRLGIVSRTPGVENGVPPLTPLRELMEVAADTSDEASSIAPSISDYGHSRDLSGSISTLPYTQRVGEQQRSARGQPINTNRNSPPRLAREDSVQKGTDFSNGSRSIHTSGSASSSQKIKAIRTSEESSPSVVEDKGESFEQLIKSDQTIQYTLTPENMRNIEAPESARLPVFDQRPPTGRSHSSSVTKFAALRSNPPMEVPRSPISPKSPKFPTLVSPYVPPAPASNKSSGSRLRPNAPQARDARVDRDSTGDFADFIRSTGPANSYEPIPPRAVQQHRGTNGTARNFSGSTPRVGTATTLPKRSESLAGRTKLQARDPVVQGGDSISDLIDFVRSGPQLDKDSHRIPRTVAPFRTTMDSDQMAGAVGGKAIDAALPDSRYSGSINSSVNSQSALLNHSSKTKPLPNFEEEDMMPKRKTRRVRDPYAIDFSDEEDELEATPRAKPAQEESLADFLRNVTPPDEPTTTSVFDSVPKPYGKNGIKKKSSTPSLMSRFGRKESISQIPPKPRTSGQDSTAPPVRKPSYTPIAAKFSTTSIPSTTKEISGDNYSSQVDSARSRTPRKNYQPREAVLPSRSRTDDLADFLMSSEPPRQSQPQTFSPTLQKEEANAFQRMFGRKKVH
ncbi:hypothetical protein LSUE1_G001834 [Lachnellula suecica]|uniref:Uncharacterized protein n=1 Tax=Lachnellula suecica TaxID=602035 RepID=A0A8T9CKS2_9HELO|nr:hypothetical protein LSUE1_G001834 [Lachnellula suecica]